MTCPKAVNNSCTDFCVLRKQCWNCQPLVRADHSLQPHGLPIYSQYLTRQSLQAQFIFEPKKSRDGWRACPMAKPAESAIGRRCPPQDLDFLPRKGPMWAAPFRRGSETAPEIALKKGQFTLSVQKSKNGQCPFQTWVWIYTRLFTVC